MNNGNEYSPEMSVLEREHPGRIRGVSCDVKSCAFHDGESFCTAGRINVGPISALRATETACATYRRRQTL